MYNFCTLFDSNYLSRGLALHSSLLQTCNNFHLFIFAFDKQCFEILTKLNLQNTTIISLNQFEDEKLLKVKPSRTPVEYCWTSTPSIILYVLQNFNIDCCTYIDADLFFYSSPKIIFDELGKDSILLTEHRYSKEYKKDFKNNGKYCVQFITFKNNEIGLTALNWWRDRCLEWCYNRVEDGKFGDQMYLNDWTTRFNDVHILQHLGAGLAGWNVSQYSFIKENNYFYGVEKKSNKKYEPIFYHFHYLKFFSNGEIELGRRIISNEVIKYFYQPYIKLLFEIEEKVKSISLDINLHGITNKEINFRTPFSYLKRNIKGTYNIYNLKKFISL